MKNRKSNTVSYRRWLPFIAIAFLATYFLVPKLNSFHASLSIIKTADWSFILLALVFFTMTYFAAALSYCLITYFKLRYWPTVLIQVANGFTNRIAPAGVGAVATNALYLIRQSKSGTQAGYVAILNNIVGFAAHATLLITLLIINHQSLGGLISFDLPELSNWWLVLVPLAGLLALLFWRQFVSFSRRNYHYVANVLKASFKRPDKLFFGFAAAMLVTTLYAFTLYAVLLAMNVHLTLLQTFLILTVSVVAMTVTPTPGGLGGVEAGLVASLLAFGVPAGPALSVMLVYRLITFWLPILPGIVALRLAVKKGYLTKKARA